MSRRGNGNVRRRRVVARESPATSSPPSPLGFPSPSPTHHRRARSATQLDYLTYPHPEGRRTPPPRIRRVYALHTVGRVSPFSGVLPEIERFNYHLLQEKGTTLTDLKLKALKDRYWAKSVNGSWSRIFFKSAIMILLFIGTAGLNAFTQKNILGHHSDNQLSETCTDFIAEGAGFPSTFLVPTMLLLVVFTCITNVIARARALGSDNDGFHAVHDLTKEQQRRFHALDKAFQAMALFPDGNNVFYISKEDKDSFGAHFISIMDLMSAKYMYDSRRSRYYDFSITSSERDLQNILSSACVQNADEEVSNKTNVIIFDGKHSRRQWHSKTCRIIFIDFSDKTFLWKNLPQEIKHVVWDAGFRVNVHRLWRGFLWGVIKGFPAFFVLLQLNKALHSLEEAFGLRDDTHWLLHVLCLAFNMLVAVNRAVINNEMKGNEG